MYSPRTSYSDGQPLHHFTGIGVVATGEVYQVELSKDFKPYRIDVTFLKAEEAPIKPLVEHLSFIKRKTHWGVAFRFGYVRIPPEDFALIANAMGAFSPHLSD